MLILGVLIGVFASLLAVSQRGPLSRMQAAGIVGMYALAFVCLGIGVWHT